MTLCSILNSLLPESQPNENIYKTYGFNDYETEDEEISKTCMTIGIIA